MLKQVQHDEVGKTIFLHTPSCALSSPMTHDTPTRSARRPNADYRWTRAKALAFLDALAESGDVSAAARQVGMSRQSAYRLRTRLGPGPFDTAWNAAQRAGRARKATRKATLSGPR